jgi:type IV pilus assembly protein PilQ
MRGFTIKFKKSKLLTFLAIVCISFSAAGENSEDPNKPEDPNMPPVTRTTSDLEQRLSKEISVDFRDTPIDDVIRIIAEQADLDIVKSPGVTGNVTVTLTNIPLKEALNNILSIHGFTYILTGNMIRIVTSEEALQKPEILQTKTFEIVYADVAEIVKALEKFRSPQGSVSSIQGTSHIIVTDTETKINEITTLINKIDRITPQILVEARIYDITSRDRLDLGIKWEAGRNTTYNANGNPDITTRTDPFLTGSFDGTTAKTESTTGELRVGWLNPSINVDFLLKAQKENVNAKLLANPRILVLDNETANIKIVSEIPYQELQETSAGGSIGTTAFREVGVELDVTPHLASRDEMIRLHLKPVFSVVTGEVQVAGVGVSYPQPVVDRREATTTLLIKNGLTVVLGGLRKRETSRQINKIPILGDLPLIGFLFRFEGEETITSELVVFITPSIVHQPVMTQDEHKAYKVTDIPGPQPESTRAETAETDGKSGK